MAAFTSKATGNWSASGQTTWNEVGVPGNGDTVAIGAGHTITVATGTTVTVGTSPAPGTNAITIASTGKLVIAADATINVRGDITATGAYATYAQAIVLEEGASFIFDASAAGTPSTAAYAIKLGVAYYTFPAIVANGTSGNRCTITSNASGANGYITENTFLGGSIDLSYCDLSRLGTASVEAIKLVQAYPAGRFKMQHCTVDGCRLVKSVSADEGSTVLISDVKFTNSADTVSMQLGSSEALTSGTRTIDGSSFDKNVEVYPPLDFTITNNYFSESITFTDADWDLFQYNLVAKTAGAPTPVQGSVADCFIYKRATTNPHFLQSGNRSQTISGCIFEHGGSNTDGDCILLGTPTGSVTCTITNNITLPNSAGDTSGTLFSALGSSNVTFSANHNTYFNDVAGTGAAIAETYAGHAGMLTSFRSNLAWSNTSATAEILQDSGTNNAFAGYVTNCGYNGVWNPRATRYDLLAGTITNDYTANDVSGDPQFVDRTRDLASWDASLGGAGTESAALARIAADPYLIDDLVTWVKAGFVVQNSAFNGTAHDAGVIGAMGYTPPGGSSYTSPGMSAYLSPAFSPANPPIIGIR